MSDIARPAQPASTPAKKAAAKKAAAKKAPVKKAAAKKAPVKKAAAKKVPAKKALAKKAAAKKAAAKKAPAKKAPAKKAPAKKAAAKKAPPAKSAPRRPAATSAGRPGVSSVPELEPTPADPLELLGLTAGYTRSQLRAAWRAFAVTHHPDRGGQASLFVRGERAYAVLLAQLDR
ncbi:MAG TPA: histone H1-like repetitive region-containing protein [Jatrophihabitans sp.]|nr:histone H1-like repetitive region-containing protein [Jatrophihabitans sp.]